MTATLLTTSATELYEVTRLVPMTVPDGSTFYRNPREIELQKALQTIKDLEKRLQAKEAEAAFYKRDWGKIVKIHEEDKRQIAALKKQNDDNRYEFNRILREIHHLKKAG